MPKQAAFNPVILSKFVLWIVVIVVATFLLHQRKVSPKIRFAFLISGTLLFGGVYGLLIRRGLNPNPVFPVRNLLSAVLRNHPLALPVIIMLVVLLLMVFISNKSICGWGCQLGLLQDLLYRVPLPKWKPPFWLSNIVRITAFAALIAGLAAADLDWIELVNPFRIFQFNFTLLVGLTSLAVLIASLFIYRPWCQFLCPFGLIGWVVEQVSLMQPRINREACKECKLCIKACPTQAMADFYEGKKFHADCFACGACIAACPHDEALSWRTKAQKYGKGVNPSTTEGMK